MTSPTSKASPSACSPSASCNKGCSKSLSDRIACTLTLVFFRCFKYRTNGLGMSKIGTESTVSNIIIEAVPGEPFHRGDLSSCLIAITIIALMRPGGLSIGVTHLYRIMKSIHPKKQIKNIVIGIHSQKKVSHVLFKE